MNKAKKAAFHFAVTAALALACLLVYRLRLSCPILTYLGVPCPACGISHAALSVLRLDFAAAWRYNPLIYLVPLALFLFWTDGKPTRHPNINRALLYLLPLVVAAWYAVRLVCKI